MGFHRPYLIVIFLLILSGAFAAFAADYDPRSVILLPKSGGELRNLEDIKKEQDQLKKNKNTTTAPSQKTLGRNQTITVAPSGQQGVVGQGPQTLPKGEKLPELTQSQIALSQAYSKHLFSSICAQNYRDELAPRSMKNLDMKRLWADVQTSCKCMSDQILAKVAPTELSDYVMFNYGRRFGADEDDPEYMEYDKSGRADAISDIASNPQIRSKCGFLN